MKHTIGMITAAGMLIMLACSSGTLTGTSEQGNARIVGAVSYGHGTTVSTATIRLRPSDYLADSTQSVSGTSQTTYDGTTDTEGNFEIADIAPGYYVLEVNDSKGLAWAGRCTIPDSPDTIDMGNTVLDSTGVIAATFKTDGGPIPTHAAVYGLERITRVNPLSGAFVLDTIPRGTWSVRFMSVHAPLSDYTLSPVTVSAADTTRLSPFTQWKHAANIVLDLAGLDQLASDSPVTNVPVAVHITYDMGIAAQAQGDLRDIRITRTTAAGVEQLLVSEVEPFASLRDTIVLWVHLDTLFPASATQRLNLYWGNAAAVAQTPSFVFDSQFDAVWHLGSAQSFQDATARNLSATPYATAPSVGAIGKGVQLLRADSSAILLPAPELAISAQSGFFSCWIKTSADYSAQEGMLFYASKTKGEGYGSDTEMHLAISAAGTVEFLIFDTLATSIPLVRSSQSVTDNEWHLVVAQWSQAGGVELFVDGLSVGSAPHGGSQEIMNGFSWLGRTPTITDKHARFFDGNIDEVRIGREIRSAQWIALTYALEKNRTRAVRIEAR